MGEEFVCNFNVKICFINFWLHFNASCGRKKSVVQAIERNPQILAAVRIQLKIKILFHYL